MLQGEHSAILSIFSKLPFVIKIFVLSIFEWLFYTGYTVIDNKKKFCASNWINDPICQEMVKFLHSSSVGDL